jgi:hypothetical protein
MWWNKNPQEQTNSWHFMTTMPKLIDLTMKWCHVCYLLLTLKNLSSQKSIRFWELFEATTRWTLSVCHGVVNLVCTIPL